MTHPRKPSVKLVHGQAITTSLKIAEAFGKRHDSVLRTIAALECSPEFRAHNFVAAEYTDAQGKPRPMFTITRDGFAFLASGFTGKEAAQWKEKYIAAFNELERRALEKATAKRLPKPVLSKVAGLSAPKPALGNVAAALPAPESLEDLATSRLRAGKFILYFGEGGFMSLFGVSRKCVVAESEELAEIIRDPKSKIETKHLPGIIAAAAARLQS